MTDKMERLLKEEMEALRQLHFRRLFLGGTSVERARYMADSVVDEIYTRVKSGELKPVVIGGRIAFNEKEFEGVLSSIKPEDEP